MFVLYSLSISLCRGMASNALLMCIVVKSVLCAGLFELMKSKTCCVRLVGIYGVCGMQLSKPVLCVYKRDNKVDYV